jgi:poly-gamma-glutamate capsule biosynthesis protein CapA/YwtB (metallophosphatase superfamily)
MRMFRRLARDRQRRTALAVVALVAISLVGCTAGPDTAHPDAAGPDTAARRSDASVSQSPPPSPAAPDTSTPPSGPAGGRPPGPSSNVVTLGFAGDVHFAEQLAPLLDRPSTALQPIAAQLSRPDLMMVNLETAITDRGSPFPKEFHFRTSPKALDALAAGGVDVVTMANNHAVDYGAVGLRDTLAAVQASPIPVVGIGRNAESAFKAYIATVRGTRIAVLAATTLPDETATSWAAGRRKPGVAVALLPRPRLVRAVHAASKQADVVVVYLHWGDENSSCPYWRPLLHARVLAAAGADVVVGSHAHVLLGAGWIGSTYVDYGLGNFVWYNQATTSTGLLTLTVRDGHVTHDAFAPADIGADGRPQFLSGSDASAAVAAWRELRGCTNLAARPGG